MPDRTILTINAGSSSLKFGLYERRDNDERLLFDGLADGVASPAGKIELKDVNGKVLRSEDTSFATQKEALAHAVKLLSELTPVEPCAVGHRVVHGGPHLQTHQLITPGVLEQLESAIHFAPLHIPSALQLIKSTTDFYPNTPQFACFDTAFHNSMPEAAMRMALPSDLFAEGVRRYGFHGLSYESIVQHFGKKLPGRTVVAHLGSGASLVALQNGRSVDTSMGLTPTGGIPMATRCGDLDPGVLLYLIRTKKMDADSLEKMLNKESGLKALSSGKSDMRELEKAAKGGDERAQLAIEIFCRSIRKTIAAYATVLGGLDMLVFAGGIGEHSEFIRSTVCDGLVFLGIHISDGWNQSHASRISTEDSKVAVVIVASEEDRQISRHCRMMMSSLIKHK